MSVEFTSFGQGSFMLPQICVCTVEACTRKASASSTDVLYVRAIVRAERPCPRQSDFLIYQLRGVRVPDTRGKDACSRQG